MKEKKLFFLLLVFLLFRGSLVYSQVPQAAILDAFKARYPNISQVQWQKERNNTRWRATFLLKGQETQVFYTAQGIYLGTQQKIHYNDLPPHIQSRFSSYEIKEVEMIFLIDEKIVYCLALAYQANKVCFYPNGETAVVPF
ncbi:MAG: hypothetical protein RML72_04565 [Bacteroidia bacterium]|nr:hypothetical protein [Bacteroidia bacterium]MDW8158135.1 hypothetical protein [Bacteroidia bacterium]